MSKRKKVPNKYSKYTKEKRKLALGNFLDEEPTKDILYFFPYPKFFTPVTEDSIKEGDWLDEFNDKPQPYRKLTYFNKLTEDQNIIYILPIDSETEGTLLGHLVEFLESFFCLRVRVIDTSRIRNYQRLLKGVKIRKIKKCRENRTGKQFFVPDLNDLMKSILPNDAYCVLGVTSVDIYHREDWGYVFGKATLKGRVGVISYCRYNKPARLRLKRVIDVATHEVLHMFGIQHCIYYRCVMNGANDLEEQDGRKQTLCPVCTRKCRKIFPFDLQKRYANLISFYRKFDIYNELVTSMDERVKFVEEMKKENLTREKLKKDFDNLDC